jgi:O-antigen/teichoic acid export membrane protein
MYTTAMAIGVIFASLKYDVCIPLLLEKEKAYKMAWICVVINILVAGLVLIIVLLFGREILSFLGIQLAGRLWLVLVSMGILFGGFLQTVNSLCIKMQTYHGISFSKGTTGIFMASLQVITGYSGWRHLGLPLSDVISRASAIIPSACSVGRGWLHSLRTLDLGGCIALVKENKTFPLLMMPSSLMNLLATQSLLLWGPKLFTIAETGAFFLAFRSLVMPGSLVATAISQVFLGKVASASKETERAAFTFSVIVGLLTIVTPLYFGVMLHGAQLFPIVFGPQWDLAGEYASIIAPQVLIWLPATATSSMFLISRKLLQSLLINTSYFILTIVALAWGSWRHSFIEAVTLLSIMSICLSTGSLAWFARLANINISKLVCAYIHSALQVNGAFLAAQFMLARISPIGSLVLWVSGTPIVLFVTMRKARNEMNVFNTSTLSVPSVIK